MAAPFDFSGMAISGNARLVFNDGRLLANEAIEERALPYIWASYDDDALAGVSHIHLIQATEVCERYRWSMMSAATLVRPQS